MYSFGNTLHVNNQHLRNKRGATVECSSDDLHTHNAFLLQGNTLIGIFLDQPLVRVRLIVRQFPGLYGLVRHPQ